MRPMAPGAYEATSLVTWYECLRCPHIWYRGKIGRVVDCRTLKGDDTA